MIKKIVGSIVIYILLLCVSQTLTLWSYLFGKNKEIVALCKDFTFDYAFHIYKYIFDSNIYHKGDYKKSDKVDIIISNHINSYDFLIHISIIKLFDSRPIYFIFKKDIVFIPGFGFWFGSGNDIKMNRKLEYDIENLTEKVNNIKEGVIFIAPEGTRFTPDKFNAAQKYSKDNNLPVFNNTLFPKMKGLFNILNLLKKNNRLGNIIDLTIEVEKLKKQKIHTLECTSRDFGDSYCIINSYKVPELYLENYNNFKIWFLDSIWVSKDKLLDNIQDKQINIYNKYLIHHKGSSYYIYIICIIIMFYLIYHTKGLYVPLSLIVSYFLMYRVYKS